MIIIIEGIDRVGKTTLANKISGEFNIPIFKQSRLGGNNIDGDSSSESDILNYGRALGIVDFWNNDCFRSNIIVDRFHWTEAVYSLVDRGDKRPYDYMSNVEYNMLKSKDKYLMIQVQPVDINWCIRQHGSDLKKHQIEFDKLYDKSMLHKYRCTYFSYDLCINEIRWRLENAKAKEAYSVLFN